MMIPSFLRFAHPTTSRVFASSSSSSTGRLLFYSTTGARQQQQQQEHQLVSGVTEDMVVKDPVLEDFLRSNFPHKYEESQTAAQALQNNWGEQRRQKPKPPLNIRSLATIKRDSDLEEGSNRCFALRREGFIPGVIYGGDPTQGIDGQDVSKRIFVKTPQNILQSELDRYGPGLGSRVFDVTIYDSRDQLLAAAKDDNSSGSSGGVVHRVMPRDIQLHPVNDMLYCCNFLRYFPGRVIKIPVTLINEEESPALKRDGFLIPINRYVECVIDEGVPIPDELEVECTGLQFRQVVRLDRVLFPDGVRPSKKVTKHKDWMIGPIHGAKRGVDGEDGEGDEEEEK